MQQTVLMHQPNKIVQIDHSDRHCAVRHLAEDFDGAFDLVLVWQKQKAYNVLHKIEEGDMGAAVGYGACCISVYILHHVVRTRQSRWPYCIYPCKRARILLFDV